MSNKPGWLIISQEGAPTPSMSKMPSSGTTMQKGISPADMVKIPQSTPVTTSGSAPAAPGGTGAQKAPS